jgi:hypothetical protein
MIRLSLSTRSPSLVGKRKGTQGQGVFLPLWDLDFSKTTYTTCQSEAEMGRIFVVTASCQSFRS